MLLVWEKQEVPGRLLGEMGQGGSPGPMKVPASGRETGNVSLNPSLHDGHPRCSSKPSFSGASCPPLSL